MKGYLAFTHKEFTEQLRTYKTFIMLAVFLLFGMTSSLLAKLVPQMLSSMSLDGMTITLPDPAYPDAYAQFFKNITQMGLIAMLLVFSGSISQELTKGTLVNMLSKGLPRSTVILSKYTANLVLWTVSFASSALLNYGYTVYLFGSHPAQNLFFSCFCLWLFGAFILAVILLAGTMAGGNYGALLVTAAVLAILLLLQTAPKIARFSPVSLASSNSAILAGTANGNDLAVAAWITVLALAACLTAALFAFRKKVL